ncbi:zinc ribbon domain-containing protein [Gordonia sp. CPCC 206044]|uniref:hypothetical protein n=1 Tax=Gordonia sp. CPCC 206044 TaxID=3140793 RepID=UPI003AF3DDB5
MSDIICEACGAANPPGTQFCTECDAYFGWSQTAAPARPATPSGMSTTTPVTPATAADASRVIAPTVEADQTALTLDPEVAVPMSLHMYNPSPVVDGYVVQIPTAPSWLRVTHEEIRLLPRSDAMVPVTFGLADGPVPEAQTVSVDLLICSLTDEHKSTPARVELTVPRFGRPVTVTAHPSMIRLLDENEGKAQLALDNSASNYPQTVSLTATEPEGVVRFDVTPARCTVEAGATATATLAFAMPELDHGATTERRLAITATSDDEHTETSVTVTQQRSQAPEHVPVTLRLEPSVMRVKDFAMADLLLVVDNRRGTQDRTLTVGGRDPEGRVSFTFPTSRIDVAAGRIATMRLTVEAEPPEIGKDVSYPFSVLANDEVEEAETTGTLTLSRSPAAITTAALRLHPSKISVRNTSTGHSRLIVDNAGSDQWLTVYLAGSDPEAAARVTVRPASVQVPPRQSVWAETTITANPPDAGESAERQLSFTATDGRGTVTCEGTFAQRTSDWMPVARVVLTLLGALVAAAGALSPWTRIPEHFFGVDRLGVAIPDDLDGELRQLFATQPPARVVVLVLAAAMALGVFARSGKTTQTAAIAMAAGFVGYMVFLATTTTGIVVGGVAYGAVLVVVGAVSGFLGGLCIRRR